MDSTPQDKSTPYNITNSPDTEMGKLRTQWMHAASYSLCALAAVGEEVSKMVSEDGTFSLVAMDTSMAQHSNGPVGGYSPPSDGEGVGQMTSDEEL